MLTHYVGCKYTYIWLWGFMTAVGISSSIFIAYYTVTSVYRSIVYTVNFNKSV